MTPGRIRLGRVLLCAAMFSLVRPATVSGAGVTHVVQISVDGLGAKYLQFYLTNAPAQFPNFVRLTVESAYTLNARCDYDNSETIPNHTSMFTGRPVLQPAGMANTIHHGINFNFPGPWDTIHASGNPSVPYKASMFDVAHDYGLTTALYAGKTRFTFCDRSYNSETGAPDLTGPDNGRDKIDLSVIADSYGATSVSNEVNTVVNDLTNSPRHYNFIHIAEPDYTGHFSAEGWGGPTWSNMVRFVDSQIGRILQAIDGNPVLSNHTALILSTDHGGVGWGHNGFTDPTNYTIPFFLRAPGIPAGANLYTLFSNRADPGESRTDYTTQAQPIRNCDGSNIALSLLGLPPIPGSFVMPAFVTPGVALTVARYNGQLGIFWTDPANEYVLEASSVLGSGADWGPITSGITTVETMKVFSVANAQELTSRYFRLRKP